MALVGILTRHMRNPLMMITLITASMSFPNQMSITLSNVEKISLDCHFVHGCFPLNYWVCVGINNDLGNCPSVTYNCSDNNHCSEMIMTSKQFPSRLQLQNQTVYNETVIEIYIVDSRTLDSACGPVLTSDCRYIRSSIRSSDMYQVNDTQFSFQVKLDLPDVSTSVSTTQQTSTLSTASGSPLNNPGMISTSADSLTSMESPGVSSTMRPLSRLATSTLINSLTDLSTKTNNQTYFTTSTSKGSDTGKGLLIGGIVGGVVCLVLAVIIIYCCWRHMCKRDSVTPENIGRKGPQRPVSNDEEAIQGPDMPVENALSRDGTTVSTGKVLLGMPEVIPSLPPERTFISTQANSSKMNGGITDSNIGNRLPALSPHDVLDMDKTKKKKKKKKKKKNKQEKQSDVHQNDEHATMVTDNETTAKKERRRKKREKRDREMIDREGLINPTTVVDASHTENDPSLSHNDRTHLLPPQQTGSQNDQTHLPQPLTVSHNVNKDPTRTKKKKRRKLEEEPDTRETSMISIDS